MGKTRGHTKKKKGFLPYRSAKKWRSSYNRQLRRANSVIAANDGGDADYLQREQVRSGDLSSHPADLW